MSTLLTLAEGYVGTPYLDGEFDCADLAAQVQWELFGRVIALPQHRRRPQGARGQAREIHRLRGEAARPIDEPVTGCGVLLYSPADDGGEPLWHIGTVFLEHGEAWVLHNSHALGSAALQRLDYLRQRGLRVEGFYEWADAEGEPCPALPALPAPAAAQLLPLPAPPAEGEPGTTLVVTPHPVLLANQRTEQAMLLPGETLASFLARHGVELGRQWRVAIGGAEVPETMWGRIKPKHGQVIEAGRVPQKEVLRLVAVIALSYFTFGAGGLAGGSFLGLTGAAGSIAAITANVVGNMLINKLLPPKPGGARPSNAAETTYSLSGGRNRARPFEPMALVLGEPYCVPDLAAQPYTYFAGGELYLWQLFHGGINCAAAHTLRLGATALGDYQDVTVSRAGFAADNTGLPALAASVDTIAGALLDAPTAPGPWTVRTSSSGAVSLAVDIEAGLSSLNSRGEYQQAQCVIGLQYRAVGSETWLPFRGTSSSLTLTNTGNKPVRATYQRQVSPGQYEVRMRKETANATLTTEANAVQWSTLKTYQLDTADYAGQARLGLQIRASGQLNGAIDELNWQATARPMPCWNGSTWITATNRATGLCNPGAQFLLLARGIFDENNRLLAGLGLPDDEIEIEQLKLFMVRCATKGFEFDLFLQENLSIDELLDAICAAGMASKSWHTGKLGVIWFAEDQVVEAVQNMATMKLKSFAVDYETLDTADEIECQYFDRERGNSWQSIRVLAPGVTTPRLTARQQLRGVSTEAHAAVLARFSMAQNVYQRKSVSFATDLEHLCFRRGTLMATSHDVTQWGYGGRLRAASRGAGDIVTLTLDELVPSVVPAAGTGRFIALRLPGETGYRLFGVASFSGPSRTVTLTTAWPSGVPLPGEGAGNPAMDTLWIYDFKPAIGQRLRVADVRPSPGLSGASATLVPEGPEFWNYVWTGEYAAPPNNSLLAQGRPVASNLTVTVQRLRQGEAYVIELTVSFDVAGNLGTVQLWAAPQGNALERQGGDIRGTRASLIVQAGQPWVIEVRPFDPLGRAGVAASTTYTVAANPPAAVQGLALAVQPRLGVVASWAPPADLAAVTWAATALRTGASFAAGTPRFQGKASSFNLGWLAAGITTAWAVHLDTAGEASAPVSASITIAAPTAPTVSAHQVSVGVVEIRYSDCTASQPLKRVLFRVGSPSQQWADAADAGAAGADQRSHSLVFPESGTYRVFLRGEDLAGNLGSITTLDLVINHATDLQELLDGALTESQLAPALAARIDRIEPLRADTDFVLDDLQRLELTRLDPLQADTSRFGHDVSRLAQALIEASLQIDRQATVMRDAGIVVDPVNGQVTISAVERTADQVSQLQVQLDAQTASINLRATVAYVDQRIAEAVLDPTALPVFSALDVRLTAAEVDIDGLQALVLLKADSATVNSQGARLSTAEAEIDGLQGEIALRASTTTVGAIDARLTTAEATLLANGDQAQSIRSLTAASFRLDEAAALEAGNSLAALLAAYGADQAAQTALAVFREEVTAKINADVSAEVTARTQLGARVGLAEAQIQTEATTRATAVDALSTLLSTVQALALSNAAQITEEQTARADADTALTSSTRQLQASNFELSREASGEAANTLSALMAQHEADTGTRAALAAAREELTAKINADVGAEVSRRLELLARVVNAEAAIIEQQTVQASDAQALAQSLTALSSTVATNQANAQTQLDTLTTQQGATASAVTQVQSRIEVRPNLVRNGGFERGLEGIDGNIDGWYTSDDVWGRVAYVAARNGSGELLWPAFPVDAGATYTVSCDSALIASSGQLWCHLMWRNAAGGVIGYSPASPITGAHNFSDAGVNRAAHQVAGIAPAGAASARARFVWSEVTGASLTGVRRLKAERGGLPATLYTAEGESLAQASILSTVKTTAETAASTGAANATAITAVQASLASTGTALAAVQDLATASASEIDGLQAQRTIKTMVRTVDGKTAIAGIGLAATAVGDVAQSEIMLLADKLTMVLGSDPNGPTQTLFTTGTVNGAAALILRAAWIGDLSVDTLQIAGQAVTEVAIVQSANVTIDQVKFVPDGYSRNTVVASRTWTPTVSGDVLVSVTGQLNYTTAAGGEVSFYSSIQKTSDPFNGFAVTNNYLRLAAGATSYQADIAKTRRLQVTAGVSTTVVFVGAKFAAGDTVTCTNVEMRIEHIKR